MSAETTRITKRLKELGDREHAAHAQRYFKTGKGEYGEGDKFLGLRVPVVRKFVREYRHISLEDTITLLKSPYHEVRLLALLILVEKFSRTDVTTEKTTIYRIYLSHTQYINNWDLVDSSAHKIVGAHLFSKNRKPIYRLARSKNLWERRIGVMATFWFINERDFTDSLALAELLLDDKEDLIHKAVGWMLREVGNRDRGIEERFLTKHYKLMPRTMLRYAIEKFPKSVRLAYLHGKK